jgi:hypothetical protein
MRVLSEWIRCRIFELVRSQSNKRSQKPPKAYSNPIHHHHDARNCHAKGLSMEGCCAKGTSTEGSSIMLSVVTQVSLQLTYQVRVSLPKPWSS